MERNNRLPTLKVCCRSPRCTTAAICRASSRCTNTRRNTAKHLSSESYGSEAAGSGVCPGVEEGEQLEDLSPLRGTVLGLWRWQSIVLSWRVRAECVCLHETGTECKVGGQDTETRWTCLCPDGFTCLRLVRFMVRVLQWYLEESAVGLQCTGEVVRVGATQAVAAAGGSSLLAVSAA